MKPDHPPPTMPPGKSYQWTAWISLALTVSCALCAVGSGLGYRAGLWHYAVGFKILGGSAALCIPATLACFAALLMNIGKSRRALLVAGAGLTLGLIIVLVPVQWKLALDRLPKIHDITTDTEDPPVFVASARLRSGSDHPVTYGGHALAVKQKAAYPDVRPLFTRSDKERVYRAALAVIRSMGLEVVASTPGTTALDDATLEAVATTILFGFKDDFAVRIRSLNGGWLVDARSMSRVGKSDLGENARRLRRFFNELRAKLS